MEGKTEIQFNANQPIYVQIMARFKQMLARGVLKPGQRIASVRDLAVEYGVNPNTMQKALSELEREGLLAGERTAGRTVSANAASIKSLREAELDAAARRFLEEVAALGVEREAILPMLAAYMQKTQEGKHA